MSEWVCHTKRVERSTDRSLPSMFTKLATKVDSQKMWLPIFGGDPKYFHPHVPPKLLFGENLQFEPMESVSAYFLIKVSSQNLTDYQRNWTVEAIETSNLAGRLDPGGPNERNVKLVFHGENFYS